MNAANEKKLERNCLLVGLGARRRRRTAAAAATEKIRLVVEMAPTIEANSSQNEDCLSGHEKLVNRLEGRLCFCSDTTTTTTTTTSLAMRRRRERHRPSGQSIDGPLRRDEAQSCGQLKRRSRSNQQVQSAARLTLAIFLCLASAITLASSNNTPPTPQTIEGCKFYPIGENRRFERVAENLPVGSELFKIEAHPRSEFKIEPIDNSLSDVNYFKYVDIDDKFVAIKLNQSLEDLVDRREPRIVLKFKLTCRGIGSQEDSFLPVTVHVNDVNDHAPEFQNVPYHLEVDELTPVGLTIFRSIHAIDRDKPNTANSDITYSIVGGNDNDSFILSDPIEGILVMNKALDYDHGKREFKIQIQASDHGNPSLSSVTTMTVKVKDADDQNPLFSHELYTASVSESAQITGKRIREKVRVEPAILAYDQDTGINARLRYSIILGNEGGFFEMNAQTGELFLIREIDLEKLTTPTLSLQIQASQVDNPFRQAHAKVDILVQDINDNSPEFEYDMYNITVIENLPPNFTVLQVFATDNDQGENAQFKYVLHDESGAFKIDPTSGWISVKDPTKLDRETTDHIQMHVTTVERKPNVNPDIGKRKRGTSVEINLLDSNDNTPFFVGAATQRPRAPSATGDQTEAELDAQHYANCLNVTNSANRQSGDSLLFNNLPILKDCVVPINLYNFNVLETAVPGTQIGHVYAYDRDLGDNGRVQYFKQNDSISLGAPFDVNPLNGSIFVLPQFTRLARKQSAYTLFVKAIDSALIHFERRHSVAVIQINVTDINNSVPEFVGLEGRGQPGASHFEAYVGESLPEGAFVTQVHARDDDSITEQLEFSIVAGNDEKLFIIDSKLGKIYTAAVLDYERKQSYDLLVQVSDGVNTAVAPLIINIIDINDQQPVFAHQFYNFTILEESGANQTVGQLVAMDRDSGKNAQLSYSLIGEQANEAFVLDPTSGLLRTRRSLDCEHEPTIDFVVLAKDAGIPQLSGSANVRVRVGDINDWAPRFEQARYELEVQEELEPPIDVAQIKAQDRDRDENAIIKYLIIGGNEQNLFSINADTGLLSTSGRLNYESKREHKLQVAARNVHPFQGPQARMIVNPAVEISVKVVDINDELVAFERPNYHWRLSELTPKNTVVGRVNASNTLRSSAEQEIVYWLGPVQVLHSNQANKRTRPANGTTTAAGQMVADGGQAVDKMATLSSKLWIDEKTGELVLTDTLDRDAPKNEHMFKLNVFARDRRSINRLNVSVPVIIDVVDVNDNAPTFDEPTYQLEMPENLPAGTTIPAFFKVHDLDSGLNGRIAGFYLNGSREELEIFHINNVTGTITLKTSLDYERKSVHKFEVLAQDGGQPTPLMGSAKVTILVSNINEFSPKFTNLPYEFQLQENAVPGTQVGQVKAIDQDGNKILYSMSDGDTDYFAIEQTTGRIYVSRKLEPRTQYSFVVRATDDGQPQNYSLGVQVILRVRDTNDHAPVFMSNSYMGTVVEKQSVSRSGQPVLVRLEAVDKDLQNNSISYSIVSGNDESIFAIDRQRGEITVAPNQAHKIDYDKRKQYTLLVQAQDSHESPLVGLTMVQLNVLDVNDHAPVFSKAAYLAQVNENSAQGTCFLRVEADSRDSNDQISYSLSWANQQQQQQQQKQETNGQISQDKSKQRAGDQTLSSLFEIHPAKGLVCSKAPLDREQRASYELLVTANDGKFESQAPISLEVLDENDNKPVFDLDQYSISLPYDSQPGRSIISVHAQDLDAGANGQLQYWIKNTHGLFQIDAKTGQVRLVTRLPAPSHQNQTQTFELRIFAQDQGSSPQIGETSLLIRLTNSVNHPPKFDKFAYQVTIDENLSGVPLIQLQASDPDVGKAGKIVYRLVRVQSASLIQRSNQHLSGQAGSSAVGGSSGNPTGGSGGSGQLLSKKSQYDQQVASEQQLDYLRTAFKIDKNSGKVLLMEPLDFEETHNVELIVEARDEALNDAQSTSAFVQVQVQDVNDNKPEFLAMPRLLRVSSSTQPNSEVIYTIQAVDFDSSNQGNNLIEYRLETPSRYFNVHPQTGVLFATQKLPSTLAEGGQSIPELEAEKLPSGATIYSETLVVVASDRSPSNPLMDKITIELEVYKDQADDPHPVFNSNQYFVQSEQSIEPGSVILTPKAFIPNGDSIIYNISQIEWGLGGLNSGVANRPQRASSGQQQRALFKRFAVDPDSGRISATNKLEPSDSMAKNIYHFLVRATNRQQPHLWNEAGVVVRLWDTSLRCPRFPFTEYYASVPESARIDSVVVPNLVIDDVEKFAGQKLSYQITEDNSNDNFFIDVSTPAANSAGQQQQQSAGGGQLQRISVSLRVKKALDRESMPKFLGGMYTLTVSASNSKCATQARVKIMIEDQNDNSPAFERQDYHVELRENSPIGHVVSQLQATDLDELDAQRLRYFIADSTASSLDSAPSALGASSGSSSAARDVFEMEQKTGTISVRSEIDRERAAKYVLKIMAVDQANNTGWTQLHVNILDENDWAPTFLNETFFMNATEGPSSLGTRIRLPVFDYDDGLNRQMEVYMVEGNSGNEFRLDVDEGGPLLTIVQELDWEKYSQLEWSPLAKSLARERQISLSGSTAVHTIQIAAKDKGQPARIGKTNVVVFINDINDNAPKFTHESYYEFIDENAPVGTVVAQVRATDLDSAQNTNLTYSFVRRATTGLAGPSGQSLAQPMQQQQQPQQPQQVSASSASAAKPPVGRQTSSTQRTPPTSDSSQSSPMASQPIGLIARPRQMRPQISTGVGEQQARRRLVKRQAPAQPSGQFPFALDPTTGVVSVARQLDISEQQQYLLTIEAYDGLWRTESQMRIFINEVEDPRDVSARSSEATNHYRFSVLENQPDALVGSVDLKPRKLRVNSQIKYSIVNIEMRQLFRISENGEIFTLRGLDREQRAQYTFTVMLEERRASSKLTVAEVIVDVIDENDEIPTFMHVYHGTIKENSPPGTPVFLLPTTTIRAVDNDTRNNSQIVYQLLGSGSDRFVIQPSGSVLFAPRDESIVLDREQRADYKLDVHATDNGNLSSKTTLTIKVEDENDNAPIYETGPLFVLIPETAKAGSKIVQVKARDRDELGPNSEIHYRISSSTFHSQQQQQSQLQQQQQQQQQHQLNDVIRIDSATGELFVVGQLQPASSYNISVTATDSGGLSAQQQVNVTVIDVNDHRPVFERPLYNFVVFEGNYSKGALKLGTLKAVDEDLGKNSQIEYLLLTDPQYEASLPIASPATNLASLLQQQQTGQQPQQQSAPLTFPISIDVHTGELFARGPIDREQRDTFMFKVMAIDMGEPALNSTCEVTIKVKDINDEPPRFYTDPYLALVPENLEPGHKVTQIAAFDPDSGENGQVFYKLGEGHEGKFYIDGKDGTVWTLASLDYEQKNFYNITIVAYDRGLPSLHSTAKLWITVADMNDAVPNFAKAVYTLEVAENAKLGDTIFVLNAGKGAFKYSWLTSSNQQANSERLLDQDGQETFSIEPSSGHIKLAKPLDSVQRNHYRLMVRAQDESEPPKFDTAEVNILVGTGQGVRLFSQRVYEISVLENQLAPLLLIDLNCTDEMIHQPVQYSIVGSDHRGLFRIEPDTGRVSVANSLDRERRDSYVIKVKAETGNLNSRQKRDINSQHRHQAAVQAAPQQTGSTLSGTSQTAGGQQPARPSPMVSHQARWSASTLTSSTTQSPGNLNGRNRLISDLNELESKFYGQSARLIAAGSASASSNASALQSLHLAYDETFVLISVDDENDNAPVFGHGDTKPAGGGQQAQALKSNGGASPSAAKPIVAAVPLEASFGYEIARIRARDADAGLNAQIRYEIQARHDDASTKFYIDPTSGVIRSMVNFALDSGRVYNFDVKATDRDGQDSGNSAFIQVFVYVLPETKMVLMVTDTEPIVMEKRAHEVIGYLSNVTGFEVKMAKLEPHIEGESPEPFSTDLFLYAVNPSLNNIVDTETLLNVFRQSSQTILSHLHSFKIRRIQGVTVQEKISQMGATEIAIIALSSIVFIGSIVAILLLCSCKSQHERTNASSSSSQQSIWDQQRAFSLKNPLMNGLAGKLGGGGPQQANQNVNGAVGPQSPSDRVNGHHQHAANHQNGTLYNSRQASNSTYSTNGDGANSSEYVDSLISYKRSSGGSGHNRASGQAAHPASGRSKARGPDWSSAIDSDLAVAMNEHHLHHLQHHHNHSQVGHHHHHYRGTATPIASAIGGLPLGAASLKGPRARLTATRQEDETCNEEDEEQQQHGHEANIEVHSDEEVFGEEEESDHQADERDSGQQQQHIMIEQHHVSGAGLKPLGSANLSRNGQGDGSSVRSADRSIYSGESNWDSTGDQEHDTHGHNNNNHNHHHHHHHHHRHLKHNIAHK